MVNRRSDHPRTGCAINAAVEVIGDRWSLLVLRDVMFGNRRHFRVLQKRSEEAIASNILADRLRRLVELCHPLMAAPAQPLRGDVAII
jgi:DNA-binding HxlR family transcriptional regulator